MNQIAHRTVRTNGIEMHVAEQGRGKPVVLCHGFPELWYSWRHQLPVLADAGFHAIAPDQRGFGKTTRPDAIDAYDIVHLTDDMLGLLDALDIERAVFVGHDWGAPVVWNMAQRAPDRVEAVVGLSVPFTPRVDVRPTESWKRLFADTWFYILHFQEPGVADAELGTDPALFLRRFLYTISGNAPIDALAPMTGPRDGRGIIERLSEPPAGAIGGWLTTDDLATYAEAFGESGFTGGLNWYRNVDRNWERSETWSSRKVTMPSMFIAGDRDPVILMSPLDAMSEWLTDLRRTVILPGAGHWTQQERPAEVNTALIDFLRGLA